MIIYVKSSGSLKTLSVVIGLITTFCFSHEASSEDKFAGKRFYDLDDLHKASVIELMNKAMTEYGVDPLDLVKSGLENFKKTNGEPTANLVKPSTRESDLPKIPTMLSPIPRIFNLAQPNVENLRADLSGQADPVDISPFNSEKLQPKKEDKIDGTQQVEPISIEKMIHEEQKDLDLDGHIEIPEGLVDYNEPEQVTRTTTTSPVPSTSISKPIDEGKKLPVEEKSNVPIPPKITTNVTSGPKEEIFEDSFIDNSDPANPKKVEVRRKDLKKVEPNGESEEHHEERVETSIGNNPNHFHKSSSTSSSTSSSYSSSSHRKQVNSQKKNSVQNKWRNNRVQRPPMAKLAPIPVIPALPPVMPFGFAPMRDPWSYYGSNIGFNYGSLYSNPYAQAYAGVPAAYINGFPTNDGMSKRQIKKMDKVNRQIRSFNPRQTRY